MKSRLLSVYSLLAIFACGTVADAVEVGVPAPAIEVTTWVQGQPVSLATARSNQLVVVEFWATWCPPCRTSIPHLTALQKKFKDVVIVGISTEELPVVKKFVKQMGDKMNYTVGVDETGKTISTYMSEFMPSAPIPYAYIVDKLGVVVWAGSPLDGLDAALADAVAGRLAGDKAKKRQAGKKLLEQFIQAASSGVDEGRLGKMAGELEALDTELGGITPGVKFDAAEVRQRIKFDGLMRDYQMAVLAGSSRTNLARIEKKLDEFAPKDFDLAGFKETMALNKVCNEYFDAASGKGNTNDLPALAKQISEANNKNPQFLLKIAWTILQLEHRDLDLAAKLAKSAVDLTESKDVDPLFVYGRVLLESGKISDAINWQKKAIEVAGDNEQVRKQLEGTLEQYQEKLAKN